MHTGGKRDRFRGRLVPTLLAGIALTALVSMLQSPGAAAGDAGRAAGSAFVITADGQLLTCAHLVSGADEVRVRIQGAEYRAAVLAADEKADLALLKVEATGLRAARLGPSRAPQPGERVWAFGYPLSTILGESVKVTGGTVSGVDVRATQQVLQIDAPVNPGSSGGPLVDASGAVVGIVNAKLSGEDVSGVGFAVPISYARSFLRREGVEIGDPLPTLSRSPAGKPFDGAAIAKAVTPAVAFVMVYKSAPEAPATPVAARTIAVGDCWSFALAPDGGTLACSGRGTRSVVLWDVVTGGLIRTLALPDTDAYRGALSDDMGKNSWIGAVTFSPDGAVLFGDNPPIAVVSWDTKTGEAVASLQAGLLGTAFLACSPNGEWLLHSADWSGYMVEALNLRTGQKRMLTSARCSGVAVSSDGSLAAIAYSPGLHADDAPQPAAGVQLIDLASGTLKRTLQPKTTGVHDVSFSPDGRYLAGVDAVQEIRDQKLIEGVGVVSIWDLQSGAIVRTLSRPGLLPGSVCFSPNGRFLAVSLYPPQASGETRVKEFRAGSTVVLWDTRTWEPSMAVPGVLGTWHTGAFSRDGRLLATHDREHGSVTVWQVPSE